MQNVNTTTASASSSVLLSRVAADHKLQTGEAFLIRGRSDKANPKKAYYHTILTGNAPAVQLDTNIPQHKLAIAELIAAATTDYLKEKAANLTPGSSVTIATITPEDLAAFILDKGNRERASISGDDLDEFATSYAMEALAMVHNWNPQQVARVSVALRQYAAPAHRKTQADAAILSARLEALPSLLTGEDAAADAQLLRVYQWLANKLQRDAATPAASLTDSI